MRRPRSGFTLIELVASAVLVAILMVALMNVVWSVARDAQFLKSAERSRASVTLLCDRMRSDFQNARGMNVDSSGVTLHGFLGEDPATLGSTLRLASVRYESTWANGQPGLLRKISDGNNSASELVWIGFGGLQIEPLAEVDPEDRVKPDPAAGGLPEIPISFRVMLSGDQGNALWREVIHHHAG